MEKKTLIKCLLFVLDKTTERFVFIPSMTAEEHPNVCELFTRNNVHILKNDEEYPLLQDALKHNQVEFLELVAMSNVGKKLYTFTSNITPFIPIGVERGNEELVRQIFGKDAAVYKFSSGVASYFDLFGYEIVDDGNLGILERLLKSRADIRWKNSAGGTLLHYAVRKQNVSLVEVLVKQRINTKAVSNNGSTALHCVIKKSHRYDKNKATAIVDLLLKSGADIDAMKEGGWTSLLLAFNMKRLHMARLLLKNGANVNIGNHDGLTPLHLAASMGELDIVYELLDLRANINATAVYRHAMGVTPLCLVLEGLLGMYPDSREEELLTLVKCFLEKGANPNIPCYNDQTVLKLAVDRGKSDVVECLLKHHPDLNNLSSKEALREAASRKEKAYQKIVKLLIDYGFTIDAEDRNDNKLLDESIRNNDYITVQQLLESGTNVNRVYSDGHHIIINTMPLFTAIRHGKNDIVKLLISHGADVHAKLNFNPRIFNNEETPIRVAVSGENIEAIKILLAENVNFSRIAGRIIGIAISKDNLELLQEVLCKGAKVSKIVKKLDTFLLHATRSGKLKAMQVLIKWGASIDARNHHGGDSLGSIHYFGGIGLHAAAKFGICCPEIVKFLVQNGGDIVARDFNGATPILLAADNIDLRSVIALLKYGASIEVINHLGVSPLHCAVCDKRSKKMFLSLLQFHFTDVGFIKRTNVYQLFNVSYIESLRNPGTSHSLYELFEQYVRERQVYRNFSEILAHHMIKLKAAIPWEEELFDFCSKKNLQAVSKKDYLMPRGKREEHVWLKFQYQCEKEVARLKTDTIGDSVASYYDILTKSDEKVSCYLQNTSIFESLKSEKYKTNFPIYAEIISCQFEKGCFRRELLNKCLKQCHLLVSLFEDLPLHLKEKVLSYLSNRDLEVAAYACECIFSASQGESAESFE